MYFHLKNKYLENNLKINKYKKRKNIANYDGRKYSNDINWWVFTKRYKNGHMVYVLPVDILDDILKISNDLSVGTISRWKEYILNSFINDRYSNGYTEGINNKIKVIKRIARV